MQQIKELDTMLLSDSVPDLSFKAMVNMQPVKERLMSPQIFMCSQLQEWAQIGTRTVVFYTAIRHNVVEKIAGFSTLAWTEFILKLMLAIQMLKRSSIIQ